MKQKGFAEILIIVIVVVLIGIGSWFFYSSNLSKSSSTEKVEVQPTFSPATSSPTAIPTQDTSQQIIDDVVSKDDEEYQYYKVTKVDGNYASGSGGSHKWIAMKENGKWNILLRMQEPPMCEDVDKYNVPKSIYGVCFQADGSER